MKTFETGAAIRIVSKHGGHVLGVAADLAALGRCWATVGHSQTVDTVGERAWELFGLVNELRAQGFLADHASSRL